MADRRQRLAWLCLALLALNLAGGAGLLGLFLAGGAACASLGLVAWLLGLRHAFDADHIAAIDNVTRHLRQQGQRPVAIGLFFSLGHSTVVILMTLAVALGLQRSHGLSSWLGTWGVPASLLGSALFLTVLGLLNLRALRARPGSPPRYGHVAHSRAMFPLGMAFGLNLDTAGEVVLLAASAAALDAAGLPLWAMMLFPLLFTAGMSAADSAEGLLMMRLYDWAVTDANRTLSLNRATTALSVVFALTVAGMQWIALAHWLGAPAVPGSIGDFIASATVGVAVTLMMATLWLVARLRRQAVATPSGPV